jgi:NADH:ubiquinone oxidoreductase subunit 3 (subunit A)
MIEVILEVLIIGLLTMLAGIILVVVNDIVGTDRSTNNHH